MYYRMVRQPPKLADQQRVLGRHLASLREVAGLYQTAIARAVPCHRTTVAHAEAGSQLPGADFWETADPSLSSSDRIPPNLSTVATSNGLQLAVWEGTSLHDGGEHDALELARRVAG